MNDERWPLDFAIKEKMFPTVVGDVMMAAMETSSIIIDWFLIYMATHEEIQEKLYKEIEEWIGLSRLPAVSDRPNCPYADAVLNEVFRFSSIASLGLAHRALKDVHFHGYLIPKDTIIMANLYGIMNDPEIWGDPGVFRPERFLDADGKSVKSAFENVVPFSTGKRVCLGEGLARDQLFLYFTSLVQRFRIGWLLQSNPVHERETRAVHRNLPLSTHFS